MPDGFTKITQEQAESCPDGDGAVKALETALQSIGVKKVSDCYWGNYKTAGSVVDMEAYLITDAQNLIVRCQYLNNNWTVVYITDSENGHLYYPTTGKDAYNYTTGELIKQEESYTSKASFWDKDDIPIYNNDNPQSYTFSGKRIHRGMYQCLNGKCLNADVNGALNILRKSNVVSLVGLYSRGEVDTPVRIRIA